MRPNAHGAELQGLVQAKNNRNREGRFGFMFKGLSAFEPPDDLLRQLGEQMREPDGANLDSPIPAGFTFFGQFIDHDMTFDRTPLGAPSSGGQAATNERTAELDLDSVYLRGPDQDGHLYDPADPAKLKIGSSATHDDLPRDTDGKTALIGDERNDENLMITQVHLAVLKFHNATVDHLRKESKTAANDVFAEAQRLTRWYYQWVVVNDFLRRVIGQTMLDTLLKPHGQGKWKIETKYYKPKSRQSPMMPVEYAAAAFRFGHSMLRAGYGINANTGALLFRAVADNTSLNGFRALPAELVVDWSRFFEVPGKPAPQMARKIDALLPSPVFSLPESVVPPTSDPAARVGSLADRNLLRGKQVGLASGQEVAKALGETPLSNQQLGVPDDPGWNGQAPLWFYLLKESELVAQGDHLGPVGGRIVGEVILGLLEAHLSSYLHQRNQNPSPFKPAAPFTDTPGQFTMADFLKFAQVV
jgi:hypothetical protein